MPEGKPRLQVKETDTYNEHLIMSAMIMNERFLREIGTIYKEQLVTSPYMKVVARWCLDFYTQHQTCPTAHIQDLFNDAIRSGLPESTVEAIAKFLSNLSLKSERGDFDNFNTDHALDIAEKHFDFLQLESVRDKLTGFLSRNDLDSANLEIGGYRRVQLPSSAGTNPFTNVELIQSAFDETEPLYTYPGDYGEMVNEFLVREGFLGIMGPEKRGKTWWLQDHSMRAAEQGRNVAFFAVGDMSAKQMALRMAISVTGRSNKQRYCGELQVPCVDCAKNQDNSCSLRRRKNNSGLLFGSADDTGKSELPVGYSPCCACAEIGRKFEPRIVYVKRPSVEPLTWPDAVKVGEWYNRVRLHGREFKLAAYPNSSINIAGLDAQLMMWEQLEGWVADVVVCDYADILAPEPGDERKDNRDKQDGNWRAMRRLSQERHCLFITATQTDADSYERGLLLPKNFSEDKRKYGHCTAMLGLNQLFNEKTVGIMRKNIIMARDAEFVPTRTVTILQSLAEGHPHIDSFWNNYLDQ